MAEGNVQLKLQATLDLEFLRAQVASLGKSLKTGSVSVVATLDTKQLQKDITKLGKEVRINVNDSQVEGARLRLAKLNQSLATFRRATATPLEIKVRYVQEGQSPVGLATQRRGTFRQRLETVNPAEIKRLYRAAAQAGIVAFDEATSRNKAKIVTSLTGAGEDAVAGLLNGVTSRKAALKTAAKSLGDDFIRALKANLDIASPSKRSRDEIGKPIGEGIEKGVESSLKQAQSLNVADLRRYFNALKAEARQGSMQVAALIAANMAGLIRLPGGREQGTRLRQSAANINAAMAGPALGGVQSRRQITRRQSETAATTTPAFLSSLPLMMGMDPREWRQRMTGLYGQRYSAPDLQGYARPNERRTSSLINLLASTRSGLGAGSGDLLGQVPRLINPSIIPSGYRNAALHPSVVNYPPGMPPAYSSGFVGGSTGRFAMGRSPMADPGVVGIFATELRQAVAAVQGFRFSLSKQLPALPAAGMTGMPGAQSRRVEQAYRRSEMRSAAILAEDVMSAVRQQVGMVSSPWGTPSNPPRTYFQYGQGLQAPGYPLQQRLTPAGFSDRIGGGGAGSGGGGGGDRGRGGPLALYRGAPLAQYAPRSELPSGYFEAGRLAASLRGADQYLRQTRVPLAGAIEELGMEFGEATKQVLLYGTAYKALAFFMDLPRQTLDAATALQTFRNQLLAVTGSSENAAASFGFVDNLAQRFAVPLQSVREGFIRLYASMSPAGFKAPEVEGLFTGISKAAATFGMSKEQVDRVTYAFSQMASKGQVMAEELRGQLGDVLPGSLALFAQAAQMSIPEFTKAMEDGRFSGEAMKVLLNNVATLMNTQFASGAQGAAQTLRGALNSMQNEVQKLYEAFEPLVNEVARQVFPLISSAVSDATTAVKAFAFAMQGQQGPAVQLTGNAEKIYQVFQQVLEIGKALQSVFISIAPTLQALGEVALFVTTQLARFINTPVGGFLAGFALKIAVATAALQLLARTGILTVISALLQMVMAMRSGTTAMIGLGNGARAAGLSMATLRTAVLALGSTAVLGAIMLLVERFMVLRSAIDGVKQSTQSMLGSISSMAQSGAVRELRNTGADLQRQIGTFEGLRPFVSGGLLGPSRQLTPEVAQRMQDIGLGGFLGTDIFGKRYVHDSVRASQVIEERLRGLRQLAASVTQKLPEAMRSAAELAGTGATELQPIPPGADATGKAEQEAERARDKQQREQERLASQEQQRILADQELRSTLNRLDFEEAKALAEQGLEHRKNMIDAEFNYREARANELQSLELRLEKQLNEARLNSEKAIQDAMLRMREARLNVQAATDKAAAARAADALMPSGSSGSLPGGARTGRVRDPDAEATGYDIVHPGGRGAAIRTPVPLTITGTGFQGSGAGSSGRGYGNWITGEFEMGGKKFELLVAHFDRIDVARGMQVPAGTSLGTQGITGRTFGTHASTHVNPLGGASTADAWNALESLTRSWEQGATGAMSGTAFSTERREEAAANELIIATRQQEIDQGTTLVDLYNKLTLASENLRASFAQAIGTALPVSQMQLDNDLLEERNRLLLSGATDEEVEAQMKRSKAIAQTNIIQKMLTRSIEETRAALAAQKKDLEAGKISQQAYDIAAGVFNKRIAEAQEDLTSSATALEAFNNELARTLEINESMEPQLRLAAALREARQELENLLSPSTQIITVANGIGTAFGDAFKGLISGASSAREIMANFFQSLSDMFANMVGKMIMEWMKTQVIKGLGSLLGGIGGLAGGISSAASTIGFGGSFDSGIGGLTGAQDFSSSFGSVPLFSGFPQFATGGIVQGPTLGLVGEGRYNEAIVPLPDGKSIPVELGGGMSGSTNVVVNIDAKGTKVQGDEPNANQLGRVVSAAVQAELIKQKRPGGLLSA